MIAAAPWQSDAMKNIPGFLGLALLLIAGPTLAGEFPRTALLAAGFREAQLSDFAGTAGYEIRAAAPSARLAVTGDFNGDGDADEARLLLNPERKLAYVAATIMQADKLDTYVLASVPLADAGRILISATECKRGTVRQTGIVIYDLERADGEVHCFDGEEFSAGPPAAKF